MWPEGSWLDTVDKRFSRPMFYAQLGPLEYILSVPGACDACRSTRRHKQWERVLMTHAV